MMNGSGHISIIPISYSDCDLIPGQVSYMKLKLLLSICSVKNPGMISALQDVLVYGKHRKEACLTHGVAQSYFSVKLQKLRYINYLVTMVNVVEQQK